jgi:hypothetical protein
MTFTTGLVLACMGGAALLALMFAAGRKTAKPKPPAEPPPGNVTPPAGTDAPYLNEILGLLWTPPGGWVQGNLVRFDTFYNEHGCFPNLVPNGMKDNGTGPNQVKITATIKETGDAQPVYCHGSGKLANDVWLPSVGIEPTTGALAGSFYFFPGRTRGWTGIETGGTCLGTVTVYPDLPEPRLPGGVTSFTVDITVTGRNRFGVETNSRRYSIVNTRRICNDPAPPIYTPPAPVQPPCGGG